MLIPDAAMTKRILETLPVGVVTQLASGEIISCNAAAEEILGLTVDQMTGRTSTDPRWRAVDEHGRDLPGEQHPPMVALRTARPVQGFVMGVHRPSGELRWLEVNAEPRLSGDGEATFVVSVFTDITRSRELLGERAEQERSLRELTEVAADLITRHDRYGECTWASAAARTLLGVAPRDLLGQFGLPLAHPDDDAAMVTQVRGLIESGDTSIPATPWRAVVTGNEPKWIETTGRIRRDANTGRPDGYILYHRDITARREAEMSAKQADLRFRAGFDDAPIAMMLLSPGGRVLTANDAAGALVGRPGDELAGRAWEALIHPDDDRSASAQLAMVLGSATTSSIGRRRFLRPDGSSSVAIHHLTAIRDDGQLVQVLSQAVDITELDRAELALRASEDRLAALIRAAPDAIVVFDSEGAIETYADGATSVFGYRTDEAIGQDVRILLRPADAVSMARRLIAYMDGEIDDLLGRHRVVGKRIDGTEFPLEINLAEVIDQGQRLFTAICRDTTAEDAALAQVQASETRFRTMADASPIGIFVTDADGAPTYTNVRWQQIMGLEADESIGSGWFENLHPDDATDVYETWMAAAAARESCRLTFRLVHHDEVRWVRAVASPVVGAEGRVEAHIGSIDDITVERAAADAVADAEERYRAVFEQSPLGVAELDADGRITRMNAAFATTFDLGDRRTGVHVADLLTADDVETVNGVLADSGATTEIEHHIHTDAGERWLLLTASSLRHTLGSGTRGVIEAADITERRQLAERLRYQADHDELTGLSNRRSFLAALDRHLAHAERYGPSGAVAMIDLDNFKAVNDQLGHAAGDELLVHLARELSDKLRASDVLARLGGDEFAVLMPVGGADSAAGLAMSLIKRIEAAAAEHLPEGVADVTGSIGAVLIDGTSTDGAALLELADQALYVAKREGKNQFRLDERRAEGSSTD